MSAAMAQSALPAGDKPALLKEAVIEALRGIHDPEIPVNIYDLGLVYTIDITEDGAVTVIMTLTAPGCPVAGEMPGWVADAVAPLPGVKQVDVELTWEPPWGMEMMSDEARLELGILHRTHIICLDKPFVLVFFCRYVFQRQEVVRRKGNPFLDNCLLVFPVL